MLEDLLKTRRSVRRYSARVPSRQDIEKCIEMAVTAPSASNKQPWRFFIVDDRQLIDRMAGEVEAGKRRISAAVDPDFRTAFDNYGEYFSRFVNAPVVIAPAFRELTLLSNMVSSGLPSGQLDEIAEMERNSGIISASLAVQNLLLYAHSIGLGASCMTGPLIAGKRLAQLLGIPESWRLLCIIPIGYPDEDPEVKPRKETEKVIRWVERLIS